ncbi:MAG TPA: GNAT family N-acetyltransferase [Bacteroidia bacterium]|nr:GNAT family N-acetyltransferase [Bacteroidia bacterium]
MQFSVRHVNPVEYERLAVLGRETFYETWKVYNTPGDMQKYLAEAFDEQKIKKDLLNFPVNTFLFVLAGNNPVGYAKIRRDRTYDEFNGAKVIEVERIYVYRKFQKQKAGIALMDECLRIAREEKNEWIWLGVNIDNHKAINFYKRYGFEIFGSKMFKLGDAEDEDYLMKLKL